MLWEEFELLSSNTSQQGIKARSSCLGFTSFLGHFSELEQEILSGLL